MRRWARLIVIGAAVALWSVPALGRADDVDPAQAAREIADARQRANDAAGAYFDQEAKIAQLTDEQDALSVKISAAQRDVDELEAKADEVALHRYVSSGSADLPLLDSFRSVDDAVQRRALIQVVAAGSADDFDRYRAARADLDAQQAALVAKQDEAVVEQQRLDQLRKDALAEVEYLKQVQADRLQDEAVRAALAAEESQRARVALQQAAAASATTTSTLALGVAGGANADRSADGDDGEPASSASTSPVGAAGTAAAAATTTTTSPMSGAGDIGGRTTPVTLPTAAAIGGVGGDYGGPGWVCPTGTAAVGFDSTFGAPRSGGRRHEGVDLIGARGTPVLAVVDGVAVGKQNALGGTTISLTGVDGNRYYYAHLDGYVNLGNVTAGEVIGILGQTGNAIYSVPHLHFEIHPGGGPAVDPYPTALAHCPRS
ncbi:MAG: peptidoglycan DD-metalloendopeptidase family protein [Ilumatobacteraceae bacterium]